LLVKKSGRERRSLRNNSPPLRQEIQHQVLSCLFLLDVLCSYVKRDGVTGIMDRCLKCRFYERFLCIMDDEDQKVMDEIDRMRRFEPHG